MTSLALVQLVKPMKAASITIEELPLPAHVGIKYDGIRAIVLNGVVLSLTLKPIRNKRVQELYGKPEYNGLDGELVVGDIYDPDVFRNTTSVVMSYDKTDDVNFYVFDDFSNPEDDYAKRAMLARLKMTAYPQDLMVDAIAPIVETFAELEAMMQEQADLGGEGLVGRKPEAPYKFGRSTVKAGSLYKMKFYDQAEFQVVGFTEQMHNANEAQVNELGRTSRSSALSGLVPKNTLGALTLRMQDGRLFNCGTGFSDELRQEIWNDRETYMGQFASVRFMATGIKDLPRHPVFQGFRHEDDINNDY